MHKMDMQVGTLPLIEVLSRLKASKTGDQQWEACCPAHEDRTASLCISRGDRHAVVMHCQAGCNTKDVLAAIGMTWKDLMPKISDDPASSKIVATYDYVDESGQLQFQVVRFEPKAFRQRRKDENGKWVWNRKGVKDVLYRLPEILSDKRMILLVEGEKDADNAFDHLGVLATTNAGGAKKFRKHHAEFLRGRSVALVPDNDPSGWSHVKAAADLLYGVAKSVSIVELPVGNKGDLSDWIKDGGTKGDLQKMLKDYVPTEGSGILEHEDDPHRLARLNLFEFRDIGGNLIYWRDEWWKYKNGCYRRISTRELKAKVNANVRKRFEVDYQNRSADDADKPIKKVRSSLVSDVLAASESMVAISSEVPQPCWLEDRSRRNYLSMKNCMLDIDALFEGEDESKVMLTHSDKWFSPMKLDYQFSPEIESRKWLNYIEKACDGDIQKLILLQEWAGYLLLPRTTEQSFLVFEGDGGTGKSSFFAGMEAMLGRSNVSHLSLEEMGETFALSSTIGKAANVAGDVGNIQGNEEAILKRFTGGETIRMRRMYIESIDVRPTAKLMMAWNERPKFRDKSRGLWRRMILIPLNRTVSDNEKIKNMDNPEFWHEERTGIFNWSLAGLERMLRNGGFSKCQASIDAIGEYQLEANPSKEFFEMYLEESENHNLRSEAIYKIYCHWSRENNTHPLGVRQFGKEIRRAFPLVQRVQQRNGSERFWVYEKLKFSVDEIYGAKTYQVGF